MTGPTPPAGGRPGGGGLAQLTRNKPLLFAGAAAVVVALYAYVKHKGTGAATTGIADGSTLAGTPGNPAALNTVGTDVASQLGQFGANQDQALAAWLANLTSTLDAAKQLPPENPSGGAGTGGVVGLDLSPKGKTISAGTGANVYDFARGIYGSDSGINTLRQLNPGFDTWITWSAPDAAGNKTPTFKKGRPVKT